MTGKRLTERSLGDHVWKPSLVFSDSFGSYHKSQDTWPLDLWPFTSYFLQCNKSKCYLMFWNRVNGCLCFQTSLCVSVDGSGRKELMDIDRIIQGKKKKKKKKRREGCSGRCMGENLTTGSILTMLSPHSLHWSSSLQHELLRPIVSLSFVCAAYLHLTLQPSQAWTP